MTPKTHKEILEILNTETFAVRPKLLKYMEGVQVEEETKEKLKSRQQEKSYHVLFQQIADHCIAHGIDTQTVTTMLERYRLETDAEFVKSVWRVILQNKTGKTSTTQQTTADIKLIQPEFERFWTEVTKEKFDWPSIQAEMDKQLDDKRYQ